jgi:hypothetical protein
VAYVSLESGLRLGALGGFRLGRILDVGRFEYRGFGLGKVWTWEESKVGEILGVRHGEIWTSGILDFGFWTGVLGRCQWG